jgi:hypothetical protein
MARSHSRCRQCHAARLLPGPCVRSAAAHLNRCAAAFSVSCSPCSWQPRCLHAGVCLTLTHGKSQPAALEERLQAALCYYAFPGVGLSEVRAASRSSIVLVLAASGTGLYSYLSL